MKHSLESAHSELVLTGENRYIKRYFWYPE